MWQVCQSLFLHTDVLGEDEWETAPVSNSFCLKEQQHAGRRGCGRDTLRVHGPHVPDAELRRTSQEQNCYSVPLGGASV